MAPEKKLLPVIAFMICGLCLTACQSATHDKHASLETTAPQNIAPAAGSEKGKLPITTDEARNAAY